MYGYSKGGWNSRNGRTFFESLSFDIMEAYWNDHRPRGRTIPLLVLSGKRLIKKG